MQGFMMVLLVLAAFGAVASLAKKDYGLFAICLLGPIAAIIRAFL